LISRTPPELAVTGSDGENRRTREFEGLTVNRDRTLGLVIVALLVAAPSLARGDTTAIVVAGDPGKKPTVVDVIAPWLESKGQSVVLDSMPQSEIDKVVDCFLADDTKCAEPLVRGSGVARFLFVMIEVASEDVTLTGWLFTGDGLIRGQQQRTCERCKADGLTRRASELVEALWRAADASQATIKITSEPSGAEVFVDDNPEGVTPVDVDVAAGPHAVRVVLQGHDVYDQFIEASGGQLVPLNAELQRSAIVKTRSRLPWFVIGGGGAAIVVSAVLFAIDVDDPPPGAMRPSSYRDTGVPAAVIGGVGVAAVGVGVYLLLRKPHESSTPIVRASGDGVVVGWGGAF
jgi:hypothetical protein